MALANAKRLGVRQPSGACATRWRLMAVADPNVAADVSPLIIPAGEKFEPTHVGCYGIANSAGATGRVTRRTKLGDDGNQIGAHSALRTLHSALERLFS